MATGAGAIAVLTIVTGCSSSGSGQPAPSHNAAPKSAGRAAYVNAIRDTLRSRSPGTEGKVWWLREGNELPNPSKGDPGWLLQTPNCWGQQTCSQPPPGGQQFLTKMQSMIRGAKKSVDIAELYHYPDKGFTDSGQFMDALVNGLREGHQDHPGNVPVVRVLIGIHPPGVMKSADLVDTLKDRVGTWVRVQSGVMNTIQTFSQSGIPVSWDHQKVIDVDGRTAIVGGMNYWPSDYLNTAHPVNDLSMVVDGEAAGDVSRFTDVVWSYVCDHQTLGFGVGIGVTNRNGTNLLPPACQWKDIPKDDVAQGDVPILIVGHLGQGIDVPGQSGKQSTPIARPPAHGNACPAPSDKDNGAGSEVNLDRGYEYRNPGETAIRTLIGLAKHSIFISQQDLLSCLPVKLLATEAKFDEGVFSALATKIKDKVPIKIVVSNGPGGGYSNFWSDAELAETLRSVVQQQYGVDANQARDMICQDVGLATIRNSPGDKNIFAPPAPKWPDGTPFWNHAKLVDVDDQAFYIGSQNLYPARLQELGFIVDDARAGAHLRDAYLNPLWDNSRSTAYLDPARPANDPYSTSRFCTS